jgi:hypothetical protein
VSPTAGLDGLPFPPVLVNSARNSPVTAKQKIFELLAMVMTGNVGYS